MLIAPLDRDRLREQFRAAEPFPFVVIDGFLEPGFAAEVAHSYPSYREAEKIGRSFKAVNEFRKTQVTDYQHFPGPVQRLADALAARDFLDSLSYITGIGNLLWDANFVGGGMHQTAASGRLDVHVDFNQLETGEYRRLNLLLYLNPTWEDAWGGGLELWGRDVKARCHYITPRLNRCVIFETSDHSFHGVTELRCPRDVSRKSFAIYLYTREAPAGWEGRSHSTVFKARPDEHLKRLLLMPAAGLGERIRRGVQGGKGLIKKVIGRS
jgi:hypothetical protein